MTELPQSFTADPTASTGSSDFQLSELFFSRTDPRGVILAGNSVLRRVTGFDWDELVGAPHKIIRHADMPKGVFFLMWERLKAGKLTGAYVKNRCKSGRHYWVFALATPIDGGFLSTRLKPSTELFHAIEDFYKQLLARERDDGLTPEQSAREIEAKVQSLGFADYDAFQATALANEYASRAERLNRPLDNVQSRFLDMSKAIAQVLTETSEMTEAFKAIRTVPLNMRLIASRLENAGGPISAISVNYSQMLEEMSTWVSTFVDGDACVFARIQHAILQGQCVSFATALEAEMIASFRSSGDAYPDDADIAKEIDLLEHHQQAFRAQTTDSLADVEQEAKRFARSVLDMKRYVTGLSSTRMMCKIESAALSNSGTALSGIVDQLDDCQNEIEDRLARIVELNSVIQGNTVMLRSLL